MLHTLFKKEFREQWRTWRFIIMVAVLIVSGLISPLLAYYTPVILRSIPNIPTGLAGIIPDPTVNDSIAQYIKNTSQFGVLLVILLTMGSLAQEKERGTLAMLLVRPISRSAVVITKWLVWVVTLLTGLALGGVMCWIYTAILFKTLPPFEFILLNVLLLVFLVVSLSVTILASSLARNQATAAGAAFAGLAILLILGSLPRLGNLMPGQLNAWGSAIVLGEPFSAWSALWVSLAIIIFSIASSCFRIEREEV